jgi:hypothetical protein
MEQRQRIQAWLACFGKGATKSLDTSGTRIGLHVGEDDEFDTKQEMIEWIKYDANNQE